MTVNMKELSSHINCDRWPKIIYALTITVTNQNSPYIKLTNQNTPNILSDQSKLSLHTCWPIKELQCLPTTTWPSLCWSRGPRTARSSAASPGTARGSTKVCLIIVILKIIWYEMLGNYFHSLIGYLVDRPVDRSCVLKELATNFREIFIVPRECPY